jgi:hypothetical protein
MAKWERDISHERQRTVILQTSLINTAIDKACLKLAIGVLEGATAGNEKLVQRAEQESARLERQHDSLAKTMALIESHWAIKVFARLIGPRLVYRFSILLTHPFLVFFLLFVLLFPLCFVLCYRRN